MKKDNELDRIKKAWGIADLVLPQDAEIIHLIDLVNLNYELKKEIQKECCVQEIKEEHLQEYFKGFKFHIFLIGPGVEGNAFTDDINTVYEDMKSYAVLCEGIGLGQNRKTLLINPRKVKFLPYTAE